MSFCLSVYKDVMEWGTKKFHEYQEWFFEMVRMVQVLTDVQNLEMKVNLPQAAVIDQGDYQMVQIELTQW